MIAYPQSIFGVEDGIFLFHQSERTLDLAFQMVAHKFGHQWWDSDPATLEDENLLTELLATYTELVVNEKKHGQEGTLAYMRTYDRRYFRFRSVMSWVESPMTRSQNQPYISRYKGPHVVYALREELGEGELNRLLRQILATDLRQLSATQVINGLIELSPMEKRPRLRELLDEVVTYSLAIVSAKQTIGDETEREISCRFKPHEPGWTRRGTAAVVRWATGWNLDCIAVNPWFGWKKSFSTRKNKPFNSW